MQKREPVITEYKVVTREDGTKYKKITKQVYSNPPKFEEIYSKAMKRRKRTIITILLFIIFFVVILIYFCF